MLDAANGVTYLAIHWTWHPDGLNEVTGGGYVRQPVTWSAAGSGVKSIAVPLAFNMPAGFTATWVGMWTAITGGTFYGMEPVDITSPSLPRPFIVDDATPDTLKSVAHGLAMGTSIVVWRGTQTLPTSTPSNLAEGTIVYAQPTTAHAFQVAQTAAGEPMNITSTGAGYWQRITPQTFPTAGVFTLSGLSFSLPGV
jgi:hypothetical protein